MPVEIEAAIIVRRDVTDWDVKRRDEMRDLKSWSHSSESEEEGRWLVENVSVT